MKVSVVVCVYNEILYVERCLRSLANQFVWFDYEVVIVDDASEDGSNKTISRFINGKKNFKLITNKENMGIGYSSNIGILASQSQYIVRVDGDDYVSEHFLSTLYLAIKSIKEKSYICCDYLLVDKDENVTKHMDALKFPIACGIIYNKDHLIAAGMYKNEKRIFEEIDLEKRISKQIQKVLIPIPLYRYRQHKSNTSRRS